MSKIIRNILAALLFSILILSFVKLESPHFVMNEPLIEPDDLVGSSIVSEDIITLSPYMLAGHFPDRKSAIIYTEPEEAAEVVLEDRGPVISDEWKFVSTIIQNDRTIYYFKNSRSGRLLELVENEENEMWTLNKIDSNFFILQNGEIEYKVMK